MEQLGIRLFGGLEIHCAQVPLASLPTQKSALLFAYLALNRDRLVHRDVICGQFWGDQPERTARKGLRTELWRIRSVVEREAAARGTYLQVEGDQVGFRDSTDVWVDALEFEECVTAMKSGSGGASGGSALERMTRAASLYRGDLLEGLYHEWAVSEQERFRLAYLSVLECLVAHNQMRQQWLEAISVARRLLRLDPLREHIHRAVMECHLAMGDRPSALRQYETCVKDLRRELEIEPMEETRGMYERLLCDEATGHGAFRALPPRKGSGELTTLAAEVDGALRTLHALTERLEKARDQLGAGDSRPPAA